MTVADMIDALTPHRDKFVFVGFDKLTIYSEMTSDNEFKTEPAVCLALDGDRVIVSCESYHGKPDVWPQKSA